MALTINLTGVEPAFAKNTAFNKNFGTSSGDILLLGSTSVPSTVLVTDSNNKVKTSSTTETQLSYLDATSSIQTQLNAKSSIASPTFTGTVVLPSTTSIGNVTDVEIGYLDNVTSSIQTQINGKSPLASPTFTGTVTSPAIVLSSETASTIASFDASKNIKSLDTTTYPSLTELSYVKGVTSAIQTQFDNAGEWIQLTGPVLSPADSTNYNIPQIYIIPSNSATARQFKFAQSGNVKIITLNMNQLGNGSSELSTVYLRNNTTGVDNLVGTFALDGGVNANTFVKYSVNIAVNDSDAYILKISTPAWVTNPTSVYFAVRIFNKS